MDTFTDLVVLFGSASLIAMVFHALKLPSLIGFIAAGLVVGPHGLSLVKGFSDVHFLTEIGVVFLMFTIGVEFSFKRLLHLRRAFLGWGSSQVLGTILLVTVVGLAFGVKGVQASFYGMLVALSSTAIILRLLQESRQMESAHGNSMVAVLLFQDLAFIPLLLTIPILGSTTDHQTSLTLSDAMVQGGTRLCAIAILVWLGSRYVIPTVLEKIVKTRSRETFYFFVLFLCFGIAYLAEHWGMSLSLGAFIAGIMLSESPYGRQAMSEIIPLRDNFLSLFFIAVGMLLDPKFVMGHAFTILLLAIGIVGLKVLVVFGSGRFLKYSTAVATMTAMGLAQVGEFSFILAEEGRRHGLLTNEGFQYFLSATILTMLLTPFVQKLAPKVIKSMGFRRFLPTADDGSYHAVRTDIRESHLPTRVDEKLTAAPPHTVIIGFGVVGQDVAQALDALSIPYKVIEMNISVVKRLKKEGKQVIFGDASREEILEEAKLDKARLVVLTVSGTHQNQGVLAALSRVRPDVHVIVRTQYLMEAQNLVHSGGIDVVVAEYETSLEVLSRALRVYGVPSSRIHEFLKQSRENFTQSTMAVTDSLRRVIDLPAWEALSSIRPFTVAHQSRADQSNLIELDLRQLTGAMIIAVYREGVGTAIPDAHFELAAGDVLHLIGAPGALDTAEEYLAAQRPQDQ